MPFADLPTSSTAARRASQRRWVKALGDRWRASGACTKCGVPVTKFRRCTACRAKQAVWHRARAARRPERYCQVHPGVRIARGCRRCAGLVASAARWERQSTMQARVGAHLLKGWSAAADAAVATGVSVESVRSAVLVFRRSKRQAFRIETERGLHPITQRTVRLYRLVPNDIELSAVEPQPMEAIT